MRLSQTFRLTRFNLNTEKATFMKFTQSQQSNLGLVLFLLGMALCVALALGTVWANFEASQFDSGIRANAVFDGLKCPPLLTRADENASIAITLVNPLERDNERPVRITITEGSVLYLRTSIERILVPASESLTLSYPIYPYDAAWGRFVLTRIYAFADQPHPSSAATCGVWVLPLHFVTGGQLLVVWIVAALLLMAGGGWLWYIANRPLRNTPLHFAQAMLSLAFIGGLAAALGAHGDWLLGGGLALVFLLASLAILNRFWE